MESLKRDFSTFLHKYKREYALAGCFLFLVMFHFLFTDNFRVDSIIKLGTRGDELNDLELGRFGITYLNRLFGMREFSPYSMAVMTMLALLASMPLMGFVLSKAAEGRLGRELALFPLIVYLSPHWLEQLYFSYQSFVIVLGYILLLLSALVPEYKKGKRWLALEILLVVIAFSVYQAFVPLYLAISVSFVLMRWMCAEERDVMWVWHRVGRAVFVFFASIIVYFIAAYLAQRSVNPTNYLSSQVLWGNMPTHGVIISIVRAARAILIGQGRIDTLAYSASAVCCAILIAVRFIPDGRDRLGVTVLGWTLLQLTIFSMIVALGTRSYIRSELATPYVTACNFMISLFLARECVRTRGSGRVYRLLSFLTAAVMLVCLYNTTSLCLKLIYTDDIRSGEDEALAAAVAVDLKEIVPEDGSKTVVFIGEPELKLNAGCTVGEVIGSSVFKRMFTLEDTNYYTRAMMAANGVHFRAMSVNDGMEAELMAQTMPNYPEEGSIMELDDVIVVKLSEDYYYGTRDLKDGYSLSHEEIVYGENILGRVDAIATDGTVIQIQGFCIRRGVDAREVTNELYLLDITTDELYHINTACDQRLALTNQFWRDETNYDQGGFTALCPMELLSQHPEDTFEPIVKYSIGGETAFVATGAYFNYRSIQGLKISTIEIGRMLSEEP